jgi:hypothetical protein
MNNEISEILLGKLNNLIIAIEEEILSEEESKALEYLNDILERINDPIISEEEKEKLKEEKTRIEERILTIAKSSSGLEFAKTLNQPETEAGFIRSVLGILNDDQAI